MENQQENKNEINLTQLSAKARSFAGSIGDSFYNGIQFIKRNIIVVGILLILGGVLGYMSDHGSQPYEHQIYAIPNFGSTEYVYTEIERLNAKIDDKDTVYLKQLGFKNTKHIIKFEIEPVEDLFNFIEQDRNNFSNEQSQRAQVLRVLSDSGDPKGLVKNATTGMHFPSHLITVTTVNKYEANELVEPLFKHLNSNPYYNTLRKEYIANAERAKAVNDSTLNQIDRILNSMPANRQSNPQLMYYNEGSLHEVIKIKAGLIKEQREKDVDLINYSDVVKNSASSLNMRIVNVASGKKVILFPILLILMFVAGARFVRYYKRQSAKRANA